MPAYLNRHPELLFPNEFFRRTQNKTCAENSVLMDLADVAGEWDPLGGVENLANDYTKPWDSYLLLIFKL